MSFRAIAAIILSMLPLPATLCAQLADVPPVENAAAYLSAAAEMMRARIDVERGGVTEAPKLLHPSLHAFLLHDYARGGSQRSRDLATTSLRMMAASSVRDQLGGGFYRAAVDTQWRRPIVDVQLTDQALMASVYLDAYQVTRDATYARVARATLDAMIRELTEPAGGFDTGSGSESTVAGDRGPEVVKDVYYAWTESEVRALFTSKSSADLAAFRFGIEPHGNIRPLAADAQLLRGRNLLYEAHGDAETRAHFGLTQQQLEASLDPIVGRMLDVRRKRPRPTVDSAVITSENALAIAALARGGAVLEETRFTTAAASGMRFILAKLYDDRTKMLRHRSGRGDVESASAADYAFTIAALLELYESRFDVQSLATAITLQQTQDRLFGAVATVEQGSDDPLPTATSVTASNLLRLGEIVDSAPWRTRALALLRANLGRLDALPRLASVFADSLVRPRVVVLIGNLSGDDAKALLRVYRERFVPHGSVVLADARLTQWVPYVKSLAPVENKATAYICHAGECTSGVTDPALLGAALAK